MTTVSEEGADICPKCKRQMENTDSIKRKVPNSGEMCIVLTYICNTEGCAWETTGRVVQTDLRGNVFKRKIGERGMDKDFPKFTPNQLSHGKRVVEDYLRKRIEDDNNLPGSRRNDELPDGVE